MEEIVANVVWMTLITDGPRHSVILPLTAPPRVTEGSAHNSQPLFVSSCPPGGVRKRVNQEERQLCLQSKRAQK